MSHDVTLIKSFLSLSLSLSLSIYIYIYFFFSPSLFIRRTFRAFRAYRACVRRIMQSKQELLLLLTYECRDCTRKRRDIQ